MFTDIMKKCVNVIKSRYKCSICGKAITKFSWNYFIVCSRLIEEKKDNFDINEYNRIIKSF